MNRISAKILADSVDTRNNRLTSVLLTFPRFILAELNTHRMFSRNSASSRAIPFKKMVKQIEEDPFIPVAWQKDHKGMQGTEYLSTNLKYPASEVGIAKSEWLKARDCSIKTASQLNSKASVSKQLCNRLLEPFMWHTALVSATEWDNFFDLRLPKYFGSHPSWKRLIELKKQDSKKEFSHIPDDIETYSIDKRLATSTSPAEIHIQLLAEAIWNAMEENSPKYLQPGEWHIPYSTNLPEKERIKIAVARVARLSYNNFNGKESILDDVLLHDRLLKSGHMSPFEHIARCMTYEEYTTAIKGQRSFNGTISWFSADSFGWSNNFKGFLQYRYLAEK
jgi:thymidylate synthase ThyX